MTADPSIALPRGLVRCPSWTLGALLALLALALPAGAARAGFPPIQHWTTPEGTRVYFVEARGLPMVDLHLVCDAGSARDGERWGLAALTAAMLDQGAGGLDADALAERFERVGAAFGAGAGRDLARVTLRSLRDPKHLEPALETFLLVVGRPDFPEEALERERQRTLVALEARQEDPGTVAGDAFMRALYGRHPYAHPVPGERRTVEALDRKALQAFHRRHYAAGNCAVTLVGDLEEEEARRIAARVAGALPPGEALPPLPQPRAPERALERRIPFPSTQTHIRLGQLGLARQDPDHFPLIVGNYVLGGGGLVSRISRTIREEHGLSYAAYSYFSPLRVPGPFVAGLQTRNAEAGKALELLREEIRRFREEGPTEEELEAARRFLTGSFPLRFDSNAKIARHLDVIAFYRLPLDWLDRYVERVRAVTREQVREAFRRRLDPGRMVLVVVGGAVADEAEEEAMEGTPGEEAPGAGP